MFARRTDVSAKRNLAFMLSYMLGWSRVLFLDDDITKLDPGDVRTAGGLLDKHSAVGLHTTATRITRSSAMPTGWPAAPSRRSWGPGRWPLSSTRSRSFFPDIYNDDWFFLLDGDRYLQPTTVTGHVYQHPYDPFRTPERARGEELGDVLAEGLYWLLDQDRSIMEADEPHWSMFLAGRPVHQGILEMVEAAAIEPAMRRTGGSRRCGDPWAAWP